MGATSIVSSSMVDSAIRFITFIWSCTKFLAPKANG